MTEKISKVPAASVKVYVVKDNDNSISFHLVRPTKIEGRWISNNSVCLPERYFSLTISNSANPIPMELALFSMLE